MASRVRGKVEFSLLERSRAGRANMFATLIGR
jgi:hypothetical protein